jgi:DNA-binding beta-propeller fold protein YncE
VEAPVKTSAGTVALYRAGDLQPLGSATVGALPDMLTFTPDGRSLLVANEGEPNDAYTTDPEGSVSIVDVRNPAAPTVRTAGFGAFNGQAAQLRAAGVRIYGPNASTAQDLEPEYITVSADGRTAWVTLQENNALAIVDVSAATVTRIVPLGYKNHLGAGNGLDASDRDGAGGAASVNIRPWPVMGMYQPDAVASYAVGGTTYLVTANEGDARDWAGLREEARVSTLPLNTSTFTDAACGGPCGAAARLGRLNVTSQTGRNSATGQFDALFAFGARSFSIWTAEGQLVWDSGDQLEQRTTALPSQQQRQRAGRPQRQQGARAGGRGAGPVRPQDLCVHRPGAHRRGDGVRRHHALRPGVRHLRQLARGRRRRPGSRGAGVRIRRGLAHGQAPAHRGTRGKRHHRHLPDRPGSVAHPGPERREDAETRSISASSHVHPANEHAPTAASPSPRARSGRTVLGIAHQVIRSACCSALPE